MSEIEKAGAEFGKAVSVEVQRVVRDEIGVAISAIVEQINEHADMRHTELRDALIDQGIRVPEMAPGRPA